jgi:CheY-like chemotaxis protein
MRRVLIIDDDEATRRLLRLTLSFGDFDVQAASNGIEALDTIAADSIDAIVVDYQMPVMNGGTFTREARARGFDAPIIMLSAWPQARFVVGINTFLSKPFDPDELLQIVTDATDAAA